MSYLVLARKYRPQTFADLIGQEQVSRTLQNALASGRVAHAYLFTGPRGVGKTTAARLLAMCLTCQDPDPAARPCQLCVNCLEIKGGQAVDVIELDGASNRGINEIRNLRETVKYSPAQSRYKVYIIDEVHALTKDAFGALLKTLEEPPPQVVFIFATTDPQKVLPTILSRCQRYDFKRITVEDIVGRLTDVAARENITAEAEAITLIARQAEGGLRDALSLMDQAIAAGDGQITLAGVQVSLGLMDPTIIMGVVNSVLKGEVGTALGFLDEAYLRGYDFSDLGLKILEFARTLALLKAGAGKKDILNLTESEIAEYSTLITDHSLATLHRHFSSWLKFQNDLNHSPAPRWTLEAQIISLAQLEPLVETGELLARLGKLLAQNPPPPRPAAVTAPSSMATMPAQAIAAPAMAVPAMPAQAVTTPPLTSPEITTSTLAPTPLQTSPKVVNSLQPGPVETTGPAASEVSLAPEVSEPKSYATWEDFWQDQQNNISETMRNMLQGAQARIWSSSHVILDLVPGKDLGPAIRRMALQELEPLFKKALGTLPSIELFQEPPVDVAAEYLAEFKNSEIGQKISQTLEGEWCEFRPQAPEEIESQTEETNKNDVEFTPEATEENDVEFPPEESEGD